MSKFGTILRDLRLERGLTQVEVGDGIGVSPQAISKWENENGMPDVVQLIPLADYFGVTVDFLLGRDPDKDEREITAHIERLRGPLTDEGKWAEQMEENRAMLRKYPKDCRLMVEMCRILYFYPKETGIDGTPESDRCADELVEWGEKVLRESTDSDLRNEAVRWLVYTLDIQGKYDKGRKYAEMMPPYELCRENLTQFLFDNDEEKLKFDQKFANRLFGDVISFIQQHAYWCRQKTYAPEERLRLCGMIRALLSAYFPDGDYDTWWYLKLIDSYLDEAEIYAEMDRPEDALESLRTAVDLAEKAKELDEKGTAFTSPFLTTLPRYSSYETVLTHCRSRFQNQYFQAFAETPTFQAEIERFNSLCTTKIPS